MSSTKRKSDFSQDDIRRVQEAIRGRMTVNAFRHLTYLDARTAISLDPLDLILGEDSPETFPDDFLDVIGDVHHELRVDSPPGPLLFYNVSGKNIRSVVPMDQLLLNTDPRVRNAAILHFDRMKNLSIPVMGPRSESAISASSPAIASDDRKIWTDAALHVFDAIADDFLVNLAGFEQSTSLDYQEGSNTYLRLLFRPSLRSLESIKLSVHLPSDHTEVIRIAESLSQSSASLEDALDSYLESLGYLPVHPAPGLVKSIERWSVSLTGWELFGRMLTWAEGKITPIACAHVCMFFLCHPTLVPVDGVSRLWGIFQSLIGKGKEDDGDFRWEWHWVVRCDLARHYGYFLQCQLPGIESERVMNLAWWLAEKVSAAFGSNPRHLKIVHKQIILTEVSTSTRAWELVKPPLLPSLLQYATFEVPSAWTLSLIVLSTAFPNALLEPAAASVAFKSVKDLLIIALLGSFPPPKPDNEVLAYAFEGGLVSAGSSWLGFGGEAEVTKPYFELLETYKGTIEEDSIRERFESLISSVPEGQFFISESIKVLSYARQLPDDLAWKYASDPSWFNPIAQRLNARALEHLAEALIQLQNQMKGRWSSSLPHFFASAMLSTPLEPDRRRLLFAYTVVCCIASETSSAITRLLTSDLRGDLQIEVFFWLQNLENSSSYGLPWFQSRIRPVLAVLNRWNSSPSSEEAVDSDKPELADIENES